MAADEKELVKRIKNSKDVGLSNPEIVRRMQKKGYRLEYIHELLGQAKSKKKVFVFLSAVFLIIVFLGVFSYFWFFNHGDKPFIENPLTGKVIYSSPRDVNEGGVLLQDVEITPDFISYLLNEIGGWKLHRNYLNGEKAVISFDISGESFYSEIDGGISSFKGEREGDVKIIMSKENVVRAVSSQNPEEYVKQKIKTGEIESEVYSSNAELISKGYLSIYNSLKTN